MIQTLFKRQSPAILKGLPELRDLIYFQESVLKASSVHDSIENFSSMHDRDFEHIPVAYAVTFTRRKNEYAQILFSADISQNCDKAE